MNSRETSQKLTESLNDSASYWLGLQGECIESAQAGTLLLCSTSKNEAPEQLQWHWPPEPTPAPDHFAVIIERVKREKKGVVLSSLDATSAASPKDNSVQLCFPMSLDNGWLAIAAYEVRPTGKEQLQRAMQQLQWGLLWLKNFLKSSGNVIAPAPASEQPKRLRKVFELLEGTINRFNCTEAASFLTTELATHLGCDRVSIGLLKAHKMQLVSLSHSAERYEKTNLIEAMEAAMEESADQRETVLFPPEKDQLGIICRVHRELAVHYGCGSILTIPFLDKNGEAYGALLLERSAQEPFDDEAIIVSEAIATLTGPVLRDKQSHELSLFRLAQKRASQQLENLLGPGNPGKKLSCFALLLGLLFLGFGRGDFKIPAEVTLSGEIQRAVVAPFAGYINSSMHRAGDRVAKDAPLATLDTSDLTLEQLQWASRKKQAELEYQKAIAGNRTADAKIILEQQKQAETQLSLLELKKNRMNIISPFTGLIVKGDLSQAIGAPVERGQVLFEMVPDNSYRILLDVDEFDIDFITIGQEGSLVFNALPQHHYMFTVEKITPVAIPANGRNRFRVEGKLHETGDGFRPGMTGYGKIFIGREPLIWIWSRPFMARLKLWFWASAW